MKINNKINALIDEITKLSTNKKIEILNNIKLKLHDISPFKNQPIDCVLWVKNESVTGNNYNPNSVAPPEMKLLEVSISEDGYTQPIVAWEVESSKYEIVDGFHRHRVGKECDDIKNSIFGYLPVTIIKDTQTDKSNRMASTIRHNRARGKHSIDAMSEIVLELKSRNWKTSRICKELGMEEDEVLRLCQINGLTELFSDAEFSQAWESDSSSVDSELDFSADFSVITQNTNDPTRIFHTADKWEATNFGFFLPKMKDKSNAEAEELFASFIGNLSEFEAGIHRVFKEWPNSCEHNLTNSSMNRIAWLGQAAACIERGIPSAHRNGFYLLSETQQKQANELALKYINIWLNEHNMNSISMEIAISHRESDLF